MNPFPSRNVPTAIARPSLLGRLAAHPLIVFLVCLVLGLAVVAWRVQGRNGAARTLARTEGRVQAAAIEAQLNQAVAAAEVLGALARQSAGVISNFQRVGTDLLRTWPGLGSLELQPNGIVSEIVPRAGHERGIGVNVLNDPAQRPGANAAIQRRALTVAGPVTLERGLLGIIARVPLFQRGRDGRDYFQGFVAVSMRLPEVLARARVDELWERGYDYVFFAPASPQQKAIAIAARGGSSMGDAVQQPVRVQDTKFCLALRPRGGWVNTTRWVIESLGVLFVSGLLCLVLNLLDSRRAVEAALTDATGQLARETAARKQAQEDCRRAGEGAAAAQAEIKTVQSSAQAAEATAAEARARSQKDLRSSADTTEAMQARLVQAESRTTELHTQLDAARLEAEQAARTRQSELDQAHAALAQNRQTIHSLEARLQTLQKESAAAAHNRRQADQATADLQARLEAATRSSQESAETNTARLRELEASNQDLRARLAKAEQAEGRVEESTARLEEARISATKAPVPDPEPAEATPLEASAADGRTDAPAATPSTDAVSQTAAPQPKPPGKREPARRKKLRRDDQMDLFEAKQPPPAEPADDAPAGVVARNEVPQPASEPETAPAVPSRDEKPARPLPATPPVIPAQLRKAVNLIVPLLTDQDPGAKDCLKDNRTTFRSGFTPDAYVEFEGCVKSGHYGSAIEQLRKAARKHGIVV